MKAKTKEALAAIFFGLLLGFLFLYGFVHLA